MVEPAGRTLARNTLYNLLGQVLPVLIGIAALPIIADALGQARFGLLALAWAILGYVGVLDLGLGRATLKFVAESLALGDRAHLQRVATVAVVSQTTMGLLGAAIAALVAPLLAGSVLGIPPALHVEARGVLLALALSVPFIVLSASLRAIIEAAQRFDLVNLIRAPTTAAMFVVPAIAAPLGVSLPGIVLWLLAVRVAACAVTLAVIPRAIPGFRWDPAPGWSALKPLLRYGGWVTVSNCANPVLLSAERFVLASLTSVAVVAYYAAPYEAVTRLLILPVSLTAALFPALSVPARAPHGAVLKPLVVRAHRTILFGLGIPIALLAGFSTDLIHVWLGPAYAPSAVVAQVLLVGVLINSLAQVPSVYLLGQGRPDIPARFHLIEVPLYILAAWILVGTFGVAGAALAWTARVTVDSGLLWGALCRVARMRPVELLGTHPGRVVLYVLLLTFTAVALHLGLGMTLAGRIALASVVTVAAAWWVWRYVADDAERAGLRALIPATG